MNRKQTFMNNKIKGTNKHIKNELIEALKKETDKTHDELCSVKIQNEELELKLKLQFSEVVVMHKHFIELRQEYLRIKNSFEKQIYELKKEIEKLGGAKALPVCISDNISNTAPATFHDIYNSKEKEEMIKTITRRGRVASEIIESNGSFSGRQKDSLNLLKTQDEKDKDGTEKEEEKNETEEDFESKKRKENFLYQSTKKSKEEENKKDWITISNTKSDKKIDVDLLHTFEHKEIVCSVKFSFCGLYFATGTNKIAKVFEVETGKLVSVLSTESINVDTEVYIRSLCFSINSLFLFTGCEDKKVKMWSIKDEKLVYTFIGHKKDVYSVLCSKNGKFLYSGSGDQKIIRWEIKSGKQQAVFSINNDKIENGITSVTLSMNDTYVAGGCLDNKIRIWNTFSKELLCTLEGHTESIYSLRFSNIDYRLVSSSLDKTAKIWLFDEKKPEKTSCIKTCNDHRDYVLSVVMSFDGKYVITSSKDKTINVSDSETGVIQFVLQGHTNSVISVDASPKDLSVFASGSGDLRARIWKINTS